MQNTSISVSHNIFTVTHAYTYIAIAHAERRVEYKVCWRNCIDQRYGLVLQHRQQRQNAVMVELRMRLVLEVAALIVDADVLRDQICAVERQQLCEHIFLIRRRQVVDEAVEHIVNCALLKKHI